MLPNMPVPWYLFRGTDITREMCSGAHIPRGNAYYCNTALHTTVTAYRLAYRSNVGFGRSPTVFGQRSVRSALPYLPNIAAVSCVGKRNHIKIYGLL